jgi:beta-lactam-binding protein with PASTA domain
MNLKLATARTRIRSRNCRVGRITRKKARRAKVGRVLRQAPRGGAVRARNFKVNLTVGRR